MKIMISVDTATDHIIGWGSTLENPNVPTVKLYTVDVDAESNFFVIPFAYKYAEGEIVFDPKKKLEDLKKAKSAEMFEICQSEITKGIIFNGVQAAYNDQELQEAKDLLDSGYMDEVFIAGMLVDAASFKKLYIQMIGSKMKKVAILKSDLAQRIEQATSPEELAAISWPYEEASHEQLEGKLDI